MKRVNEGVEEGLKESCELGRVRTEKGRGTGGGVEEIRFRKGGRKNPYFSRTVNPLRHTFTPGVPLPAPPSTSSPLLHPQVLLVFPLHFRSKYHVFLTLFNFPTSVPFHLVFFLSRSSSSYFNVKCFYLLKKRGNICK